MIEYYRLKNSPKIEETFKAGIQNKGNVAQMLKPLYLEWLVLNKGITEARKIFETSELQNPPCLEVFKMMGALEINQPECSHKHVRRCHELACSYFGKSDSSKNSTFRVK